MMGHHRPEYHTWIEFAGYQKAKDLLTYEVNIAEWHDERIFCLIEAGERNPRIAFSTGRQNEVRPGSKPDPQSLERRMVEQLGLCPAHRIGNRLCRQKAETDHLQ